MYKKPLVRSDMSSHPSPDNPDLNTWHHEGFKVYMANSDKCAKSNAYFEGKRHLLENVVSCISIGPASGDVDIPILKLMPKCGRYYGIEPDVTAAAILETALSKEFPQMQVTITRNVVQNDMGPSAPVDLILVQNCLYYLSDADVRSLCVKLGHWTKRGGHVAVAHCTTRLPVNPLIPDNIRDATRDHLNVLKTALWDTFTTISDEVVVHTLCLKARNPLLGSFLAGSALDNKQVVEFYDFMAKEYPEGCIRSSMAMIIFQK